MTLFLKVPIVSYMDATTFDETYTIRPTDYAGYVIKARCVKGSDAVHVTCYAPNGTESGVLPTVVDAEDWMIRHFQADIAA